MQVYIISSLSSLAFSKLAVWNKLSVTGSSGRIGSYSRLSYRLFAFLSFCPLFVVSAIRYRITFDYFATYVPLYYRVVSGQNVHSEFGFNFLIRVVNTVFHNVDWLFVVTSLIFLGLIFAVIYRDSANIPLSIFIMIGSGMYFTSFGQIRQYIVIALFLFCLRFIREGRLAVYLVCILAAATFHKLALSYLPVYFFCRLKLSRRIYLISAAVVCAASATVQVVILYFAGKFYGSYVAAGYGIDHTSGTMIFLTAFSFVLTTVYYNRFPATNESTVLVNLQWISAVVAITAIGIPESYRILALFLYSSIFLLPLILKTEQNKIVRWALTAGIIALYTVSAMRYLTPEGHMLPFRTIFDK